MGYYNLGFVSYASDDFEGALEPLRKSIALAREVLPPNHPELGGSLGALCRTEEELGHYDEAVAACAESRDILRATGELDAEQLADTTLGLAEVTIKAGDLDEADALLGELEATVADLPESSVDASARLYAAQGQFSRAKGDLSKAQSLLEQSVEAFKRTEHGREYKVGAARLELAEIVSERGDTAYASELLDDVLKAEHSDARSLRKKARAMKERLETP